jgi:peptidoglycan hydrolase-like protein with peptidoglycan-binding domain
MMRRALGRTVTVRANRAPYLRFDAHGVNHAITHYSGARRSGFDKTPPEQARMGQKAQAGATALTCATHWAGTFFDMLRHFVAVLTFTLMLARAATGQQDIAWVQIEAQPTLAEATARAQVYAASLPDVNGFALPSGWYAVALGPYAREDAEQVLRVYRAEGTIPRDSFIAFTAAFTQQFWPVGANLLGLGAPSLPTDTGQEQSQEAPLLTDEAGIPQPPLPDESPNEARASEAALSREARESLQVALKWAGFYDGPIDGAFGRGTRMSMADWQAANGFVQTGVLTTLQRATLLDQYNAVLAGLELQMVRDTRAGIEMLLPLGVVAFDRIEPPFVHYEASSDLDARVLLISQDGDRDTLFGLYDIMQTLAIVPLDGPRERREDGFTLIGQGGDFVSHTEVSLRDGQIKGFTLLWPAGDEERRTRLLSEMQRSFTRLDGVLRFSDGGESAQRIDLVSGLEVRKPRLTRSGFFVDATGTVVTSLDAVDGCGRITLDNDVAAQVLGTDAGLGIAVLRPDVALAPGAVAQFQTVPPRLQAEIAVAGFSYGGILSAPTLTFGRLAEVQGLNGEAELKRLALEALPGDVGGPVFDAGGAVLGMLRVTDLDGRQLPADVSFSVDAGAIRAVLDRLGVASTSATGEATIDPVGLTRQASRMTVLVGCWD